MLKRTDITKCRIELLKQFDYYIRNMIGGDDITVDIWLRDGLPDGYDEDELHFIATDEECWLNCVDSFFECCKAAGVIE